MSSGTGLLNSERMAETERKPTVSIGMPVFNGAACLQEALESLLAQSHLDFELIVSDNASTDQTAAICKDFAERDSRIKLHLHSVNQGALWNFNFVLKEARGDFFMWAAHDDLWHPEFLAVILGGFASPKVALGFCAFQSITADGASLKTYSLSPLVCDDVQGRLARFVRMYEGDGKANLIYGLFRRQQLMNADGFFSWNRTTWGADMLVVFRILSEGELYLSDQILFFKRQPAAPAAPGSAARAKRTLRGWLNWLDYFLGYVRIIVGMRAVAIWCRLVLLSVVLGRLAAAIGRRAVYSGGVSVRVWGKLYRRLFGRFSG